MDRTLAVVVTVALLAATPGLAGAVVGVLGQSGPAGSALSAATTATADDSHHAVGSAPAAVGTGAAADGVDVSTGSQLSTVLAATEANVSASVTRSTFERRFRSGNETERARAVTARASTLRREAGDLDAAYRNATDAFRDGRTDRETFAQRLASLHARARELRVNVERLRDRAGTVSELALATAGYDESVLAAAESDLDAVSGATAAALLRRFTGQSNGSVNVSAGDGVSIAVESDDGERTREVTWPADDNRTVTISQATALGAARDVLPARDWVLRESSVDEDEGSYEFEFAFEAANATGEAEVRVDGSSGRVVRVEQETEERDDDTPDDRESDSLVLLVVAGDPAPNATVTLEARRNGSPAAGVPVSVDGERVGTTDADGRIDVTLGVEETRVEADDGEDTARLEFEFDDADADEDLRNLTVDATLADGTVTVSVTYRGDGVAGAAVSANGDRVGTTDEDGSVSFPLGNETRVDLEITRGEIDIDRRYYVSNGTLARQEPEDDEEQERGENETEPETETEAASAERTLDLSVVEGDPAPNTTVTVQATVNGTGVAGAVVSVDDERVGTTDADGRISVTLRGERTEVTATYDDLEAELEFRFDDEKEDEEDEDEEKEEEEEEEEEEEQEEEGEEDDEE